MITWKQMSVYGRDSADNHVGSKPVAEGCPDDFSFLGSVRRLRGQLASDITDLSVRTTYFWVDQCNLAFNAQELSEMAAMNASLWVSCVEDEPSLDEG